MLPARHLAGVILASALITLDGTATTVALPAIGRELSMPVSRLQWIGNAPLLMLAAMLLPAGAVADRYPRGRVIRIGLAAFAAAALVCAAAQSAAMLIAARFLQGAAGALILPAALAVLRAAHEDAAERTRVFGVWAAWTGAASAAGPLLAGAAVETLSWRAVLVGSSSVAAVGALLVRSEGSRQLETRPQPLPVLPAVATVVLVGAIAYLLVEGPAGGAGAWQLALAGALMLAAVGILAFSSSWRALLPRELLRAHNCLPANGATFALYFGLFGLSFLLVLYTQQALGYSALGAAAVLLPVSIMLLFAERFGRLAGRLGIRPLIILGAVTGAAGLFWLAAAPHPLAFWSRMIAGTAVFGLGISLAVSALTHAAVAAVPERWAGAASGLNHATVRAAGLVAIALLGSVAAYGSPQEISPAGFARAMTIGAVAVAVLGVGSSVLIRERAPGGLARAIDLSAAGLDDRPVRSS